MNIDVTEPSIKLTLDIGEASSLYDSLEDCEGLNRTTNLIRHHLGAFLEEAGVFDDDPDPEPEPVAFVKPSIVVGSPFTRVEFGEADCA